MNIDYVKTPFTNNPSMTRLEGPVYNKNPEKVYLHEKQQQIDLLGDQLLGDCLLYTSPSPRDRTRSRMPSSA